MIEQKETTVFALSRRGLLSGGAALSVLALSGCGRGGAGAKAARPIGIQLYTVRAEMAKDVPGTLKQIADIGYKEVEFHDYFGTAPAEIKKMVADLGMTAPSVHLNALEMRENPEPLLAAAKEAGHDFALIAWLPPEERQTIDQYKAWTDVYNSLGEQCRDIGLRFAYHNHNFEFAPIDGVVPYDVVLERTDPSLVQFELDFYWVEKAGAKIEDVLAKAPGRFPLCHIKDMDSSGEMADVGDGIIDFAAILSNKAISNFEHYYVERDDAPAPFDSAKASFIGLEHIMERVPSAQ